MNHDDDIAGIDGCRAGWIVATTHGAFVDATLNVRGFKLIGIDMPIGLVDGPQRACDVEARKYLGRRGSAVFPAPPRACLPCTDYRSALATARSTTGRGISVQTFNIMPKVAEVDGLISTATGDLGVVEVHPECTFKMLNGGHGLPSKKSDDGRTLRQHLLRAHFDVPAVVPPGAAIDDLLDAYAVLVSTMRFRRGEHRVFGDGQRDTRGLEMRIVC